MKKIVGLLLVAGAIGMFAYARMQPADNVVMVMYVGSVLAGLIGIGYLVK